MALIYQAQLTPSKIEVLRAWVPAQPWLGDVDASTLESVGAYRFDDPAGEVGVETHLVRAADGRVLQVPLTYRNGPLAGAASALLATMQHSVLGERWVYDACADPVYAAALATTILTGGTEATHEVVTGGANVLRPSTTRVTGSGSPGSKLPGFGPATHAAEGTTTVITMATLSLTLLRVIGAPGSGGAPTLTGTWPGREVPALLAVAHVPARSA
jgi:hypothetical protein